MDTEFMQLIALFIKSVALCMLVEPNALISKQWANEIFYRCKEIKKIMEYAQNLAHSPI